jgi:CBS domain-containing protein
MTTFKRRKTKKLKHLDSLLIHGRVSDFMSTPPITQRKDASMRDAKTLMKENGISGIPIVDNDGKLAGLISIENIIIALEKGHIDDIIENHMIVEVVSVQNDMDVSTVMGYLMNYNFGRYPVVDQDRIVVGLITKGDLMEFLYAKLGSIYMHNKRRDDVLIPDISPPTEKTSIHGANYSYIIDNDDLDHAGEGATQFKKYLKENNCNTDVARRASIALYEAEVNVVLHGGGVGFIKAYLKDSQVFVVIIDHGPGIENIDLAMQPGWTTASDEVRERGFGAGMGLANIKKYSDKLVILSTCAGVKIEMVIIPSVKGKDKVKKKVQTSGEKELEKFLKGEG